MIQLTRLNKEPLLVNSDLIKFVDRAPDTVITLLAGDKIVVRETSEEILAKIIEFRRSISSRPAGLFSAERNVTPPVPVLDSKTISDEQP